MFKGGTFCFPIVALSTLIYECVLQYYQGSIHQGHEAFSEHSRVCAFMSLAALLFNRSNLVDLCVSQCYSLYLLFSLTDIFVVNFSNYYNYIYSQRICNLCK